MTLNEYGLSMMRRPTVGIFSTTGDVCSNIYSSSFIPQCNYPVASEKGYAIEMTKPQTINE